MSAPTGEREGARPPLTDADLAELHALADGGEATALEWRAAALAAHPYLLAEVERSRRAAPAQPGEGEPSADEVWSALEAVVNSFTLPEEEAAHAAARALLERRGGKGLSGKGGG